MGLVRAALMTFLLYGCSVFERTDIPSPEMLATTRDLNSAEMDKAICTNRLPRIQNAIREGDPDQGASTQRWL